MEVLVLLSTSTLSPKPFLNLWKLKVSVSDRDLFSLVSTSIVLMLLMANLMLDGGIEHLEPPCVHTCMGGTDMPHCAVVQDYLNTCHRFLELTPKVIVPAHGHPTLWPMHLLQSYIK